MTEESVFLVTEVWMNPGSFEKFKVYRKVVNDILAVYKPEYIFHNHAFEWVYGADEGAYPTGVEIIRFENEAIAREAISELSKIEVKEMEKAVFRRVRCYLSRYAPPVGLKDKVEW